MFKQLKYIRLRNLVLPLALGLSGCLTTPEIQQAEQRYSNTENEITPLALKVPQAFYFEEKSSAVHVKDRPWLGLTKLPEPKGKFLPEHLRVAQGITLPFEKALEPGQVASRIYAAASIPVIFIGSASEETPVVQPFNPVTTMPTTVSQGVAWTGPLDILLDQWTAWYGYSWEYDGERINVYKSTSAVFVVNALAGAKELTTNLGSEAQTAESSSLSKQTLTTAQIFEIWKEIDSQIKTITSTGTSTSVSPVNGTLTIKGLPTDIKKVRNFLEYQNNEILRPITVSVRILNVSRDQRADYGVDLALLLKDVLGKQSLQLESSAASNILGLVRPVPNGKTAGTVSATIEALSRLGTVSRELNTSASTLNGHPIAFHDIVQQTYIARSSSVVSDGGVVSNDVTPGTVNSGYFFSAMPRIVSQDGILVRMTIGLEDTLQIRELTVGDTTVGLPEQASRSITVEQVIRNGETLILSSSSDSNNSTDRAGPISSNNWLFGGKQNGRLRDSDQIILITAQISPPLGIREYSGKAL